METCRVISVTYHQRLISKYELASAPKSAGLFVRLTLQKCECEDIEEEAGAAPLRRSGGSVAARPVCQPGGPMPSAPAPGGLLPAARLAGTEQSGAVAHRTVRASPYFGLTLLRSMSMEPFKVSSLRRAVTMTQHTLTLKSRDCCITLVRLIQGPGSHPVCSRGLTLHVPPHGSGSHPACTSQGSGEGPTLHVGPLPLNDTENPLTTTITITIIICPGPPCHAVPCRSSPEA